MFDRFSSVRDVFIRLCLGVVFFTSACGAPPPVGASPQIIPTCPPTSTNPYRLHQPPNQVTNIFSRFKTNAMSYESARQDAFIQLGENIENWSAHEDVTIDGSTVRVTVTYLDPMLVQYIVLNEALAPSNNSLDQSWFENQIQSAMTRLANRNEIMFIITITSLPSDNTVYVEVPVTNLELIGTSGIRLQPTHYDPVLVKRNDVSKKNLYGFVGYPVSLSLQEGCAGVIDQWTTSFILDHNGSLPKENPFYNHFWNITYEAPVVLQGNTRPVPTVDPFFNIERYNKTDTLPSPNLLTSDENTNFYWEEMARYIRSKVIMMESQ